MAINRTRRRRKIAQETALSTNPITYTIHWRMQDSTKGMQGWIDTLIERA